MESFFQELKRYAPHYTPDLNLSDEQGVGVALMKIFAQLAEIVSVRLDQAPQKHFVAFLDHLGISLLPARSAQAAVTFRLVSDLQESVKVPIGTRVPAPGKDDDIPFETTGELVAIPGVLKAAYGVDPLKDTIFGPPPDFLKQESRQPSELSYKLQSLVSADSNRLQLDDNSELKPDSFVLIGCAEKRIVQKKDEGGFITLYKPVSQTFPAETSVLPIRDFEVFSGIDIQEHVLYIGHATLLIVEDQAEIRLEVTLKDPVKGFEPRDLIWEFWTKNEEATPEEEEHWEPLEVKADKTFGLAASGEIVLVKKAGLEIKPRQVGGNQSRWIRGRLTKKLPVGARILPEIATIKLSVSTGEDLSTGTPKPKAIRADQGFYNATPLNVKVDAGIGFFPFGTEPRQFDQFYIASKEAFSKREAAAVLNFDLDLQTLAAPSVVNAGSGLRAYSIGLRHRLYELDLNGGTFNVLGNPSESKASPFLPADHSAPSSITNDTSGIFVVVNTVDSLAADNPASKIWVHFHTSSQSTGTWTDLEAPGGTPTIRLRFSPAVVRTPSTWTDFSRVFVVGADGRLYSRVVPATAAGWVDHGSPGVSLDSSPFAVVAKDKIFVFVNGAGKVHLLPLAQNLTGTWKSLKATNTSPTFSAAYRPFAQSYLDGSGNEQAKVFTFAFTDATDLKTGRLFECDTKSEDSSHEFVWDDLGRPTATEVTDKTSEAHAPSGHLEHPEKAVSTLTQGLHIFLRGADNNLYERVDGTPDGSSEWKLRSRPGESDLRDSPAVHVERSGDITTIQVVSASVQNSLVQWLFEARRITGVTTANVNKFGVLLNKITASSEHHKYDTKPLKIIYPGTTPSLTAVIDAYDGDHKLARLPSTWTTEPDSTSTADIVGGANLGLAEDDADQILAVDTAATLADLFSARGIYLRINGVFKNFNFYSRVTGMVSLAVADHPALAATFDIYSELTGITKFATEFPSPEDTGTVPELSWEYWNGRGWLSIRKVSDDTHNLLRNGQVEFDVPKDIESTEVAGQENYWIRARLVGGDYGHETFRIENNKVVSEKTSLRPPKVRTLGISYQAKSASPEACLTFNNLDYIDQTAACQTAGSHFRPFETLEDSSLTLFFGFDKTFKTGPVRLLLDAAERNFDESNPPELRWNFRRDRQWKPLDAEDGSVALTRQGIVTLSASEELTRETRFGQSLFWIKGSLRSDRGSPGNGTESVAAEIPSSETKAKAEAPCSCRCSCSCAEKAISFEDPCAGFQDQTINASQAVVATALLRGVFPNTVWATQGETITEEIIGSGDGDQNQTHKFQHGDVLKDEDVRVQEVLSVEERERIERELGKESVTDREDLGGTWVRWKATKALFDSGPQDRCYEIDRATGSLRFGDGEHGRIPPAGVDNIRAFRYRTGGGSLGNVAANKIQSLATAVEGIESVFNPSPAGGGSDKADTNAMLTIGPRRISHLDRAVSVEDFEELAYEASRQVAKVRCLATTNLTLSGVGKPDPCDPGQLHEAVEERGRVSLIIVPYSSEPRPCPSLELRRSVKDYLRERAPTSLAGDERIVVRPPDYVTVGVEADIFVTTLERAAAAESNARNKLTDFLHPVSGGPDGTGWDFGRSISKSDVFAVLERIPDIDRVENLSFQFRGQKNSDVVAIGPNELLASGEHTLAIKKA